MPFSTTEHGPDNGRHVVTDSQWAYIFEHWIKKAVESYKPGEFVCKRSPAKPGNFVKGIVADLDSSDLVIADLTGAKPNVYYELGIRHALRAGTIMITQHFDALPSDLKNYYTFEYAYSDTAHEYEEYFRKFEQKMHETMRAWDDTTDPSDSPVSDFLGIFNQRLAVELEAEKEELKSTFSKIKKHFSHNFEICEVIHGIIKTGTQRDTDELFVIDVFAIDVIYSRLVGYAWKHIKDESLDPIEDIILHHRRLFNEVSMIWNTLHVNPAQHDLAEYLYKLLEAASKAKKRFDKEWDSQIIPAIDSIKLVKLGNEKP